QLRPADSIFDVRFLDNPFYVDELRDKTGLSKVVKDYVFSDDRAGKFIDRLLDMHRFLLPNYYSEGKHYLRIGIGCTGGRHRSVAIAEEFGRRLAEADLVNVLVSVVHRDVNEVSVLARQQKYRI